MARGNIGLRGEMCCINALGAQHKRRIGQVLRLFGKESIALLSGQRQQNGPGLRKISQCGGGVQACGQADTRQIAGIFARLCHFGHSCCISAPKPHIHPVARYGNGKGRAECAGANHRDAHAFGPFLP